MYNLSKTITVHVDPEYVYEVTDSADDLSLVYREFASASSGQNDREIMISFGSNEEMRAKAMLAIAGE